MFLPQNNINWINDSAPKDIPNIEFLVINNVLLIGAYVLHSMHPTTTIILSCFDIWQIFEKSFLFGFIYIDPLSVRKKQKFKKKTIFEVICYVVFLAPEIHKKNRPVNM